MQTETHSINDVLSKNATAFFIPPFQRAYAWGKTEIERYFSDIMRIINSELDETQSDKLEHFFGTLVIKEEKSGFINRSYKFVKRTNISLRGLTNSAVSQTIVEKRHTNCKFCKSVY